MTVLFRSRILGHTISILETEHEIHIETPPDLDESQKQAIENYLANEGILDEILAG